jgi:transposase
MARGFNPTALIPPGVVMESVDYTGTAVVITVRSSTSVGDCPGCGGTSYRMHSRYARSVADLPLSGRPVQLKLLAWRFRCESRLPRLASRCRGMGHSATTGRAGQRRGLSRVPSARTVARLMTTARDSLSKTQTLTVTTIETAVLTLVQGREILDALHTLIRRKQETALDSWLDQAAASLLAPFARGLARDQLAVRAAIASAWSNAQAEGQINKLR